MSKLTAVDFFAGGGGLSEGLKQAGFDVVAAVEIDKNAARTYKANHPDTHLISTDIRYVSGNTILDKLKGSQLDLLAACPPCQGFSSLTRSSKVEDPRNSLIGEVTRLIKTLLPKTIMIENVPGITSRGERYLGEFLNALTSMGYNYSYSVLQVADYGVPQLRKRFVLLANLGNKIEIPRKTHSSKKEDGVSGWKTVKDAIGNMPESVTLDQAYLYGGFEALNWHVTRSISDLTKKRLEFIKPGGSRFDLPDDLRPNCHKGNNTGFSNVYGRMAWDKPSPTITGGCTTLSKGRFGHPEKMRTITIREAALLQTFPENYSFEASSIDDVCKIIGNALPCLFAKIMATACKESIVKDSISV
ncbi:DNA cytosine methyltransferase [Pantoea ananatis]